MMASGTFINQNKGEVIGPINKINTNLASSGINFFVP